MRIALLILLAFFSARPAMADEARVAIHSARPFGYFVGDLICARVEVTAPPGANLSASSLPRPGPLGVSLDLRSASVRETTEGARKRWDIDLVYQNFYVALDARKIEIPAFDLRVGDETVVVPSWRVGVAPLREIAPAQEERAEDYLRPDAPTIFAQERPARGFAIASAVLWLLSLAAVARDRAWPPFQRRRARIFNALARQLAAGARAAHDENALAQAIRRMHRAIDAANGASLLAEDVPKFLSRRQEFASLQPSFDRFFAASRRAFFSERGDLGGDYGFTELLGFARALARQERAR